MQCPGVDKYTVALWLFDETPYPNVILTDAGPLQLDLRISSGFRQKLPLSMLENRRGLVSGKYGRALSLPIAPGVWIDHPDILRDPGAPAGTKADLPPAFDRGHELPERCNLGSLDFTIEFWFKSQGEQDSPGALWSIRNRKPVSPREGYLYNENSLIIDTGRRGFRISSLGSRPKNSWKYDIVIPSDSDKLNDGFWHHLAFTFTAAEKQMRHYVDGMAQALPEPGCMLPVRGFIDNMTVGNDTDGSFPVSGLLDEYRISDAVRYSGSFTPPGSFSKNYGEKALLLPNSSKSNGKPLFGLLSGRVRSKDTLRGHGRNKSKPLLFAGNKSPDIIGLGNRKHLFIDSVMLDMAENVVLTVNKPEKTEVSDFRVTGSWEPSTRLGPMIPDICSIWDEGGKLRMLYGNNGQFCGKYTAVSLAESDDGIHWVKPDLGIICWEGSTHNNIVMRNALQGTAIKDENPACPPDERYKMAAWTMNRGLHIFTSPDSIHWRRNETLMFPFDPDGSVEIFWDNQIQKYVGYSRALWGGDYRRYVVRSETAEIDKPWPFTPSPEPRWHEYENFGMVRPCEGELQLMETWGEAYRFKGHKYPWAPDAYLAFPWRHDRDRNARPGSYLQTSRDGVNWTRYEPPYYFGGGWELGGKIVREGMVEQGMVLRGDEIWHFGTARFTEHGGLTHGGTEHDGGYFDKFLKLTQRLDGFVSADAKDGARGVMRTKPLIFEGKELFVNAKAKGFLRAGLLDAEGNQLEGYCLRDCAAFTGDKTRVPVRWRGNGNVARLQGKPIRILFELKEAKLFSFQFS